MSENKSFETRTVSWPQEYHDRLKGVKLTADEICKIDKLVHQAYKPAGKVLSVMGGMVTLDTVLMYIAYIYSLRAQKMDFCYGLMAFYLAQVIGSMAYGANMLRQQRRLDRTVNDIIANNQRQR